MPGISSVDPDNEAAYSGNTAEATQLAYSSSGEVTAVTQPAWLTKCNGASGTPLCAPETTFSYSSYDTSTDTGTVLVSDPNENYDSSSALNDGNGNVTLDRYADGVLMSQLNGYGYETSTTSPYDQYATATAATSSVADPFTLLPVASLDADGNITTDVYDAQGNVISSTDPLGNSTSYIYNAFNEVLQKTDPMGYVTSSTYDVDGNELTMTDADGNVTEWTYGSGAPAGLAHTMTDPLGVKAGSGGITTYGYDSEGDLTSTTDPDGDVTSTLYNGAGEVCASLSADGYAASDRIPSSCRSSAAASRTATTAYDTFGDVLTVLDPSNTSYCKC